MRKLELQDIQEKRTTRGVYGWLLQRITGLFLAFFLIVHLNVMHFSQGSLEIDFAAVTQRLQSSPFWGIFYLLFVPAVVFHGLNGIWGIYLDYQPGPRAKKSVLAILWLIGIGLTLYGAWGLVPLFYA